MRQRLGWKCDFVLKNQTEFSEPRTRINTNYCDAGILDWSETAAWDKLAAYYAELFGGR